MFFAVVRLHVVRGAELHADRAAVGVDLRGGDAGGFSGLGAIGEDAAADRKSFIEIEARSEPRVPSRAPIDPPTLVAKPRSNFSLERDMSGPYFPRDPQA